MKSNELKEKSYYCENCNLDFSSIEENGYKVVCPYCGSHLNKEMLDSYYKCITYQNERGCIPKLSGEL